MNWCEVSVAVAVEQAEIAADALRTVAMGGVAIEDPLVPLGPEEGVRLDRRRPSIIKAYLPVDDRLGERTEEIKLALARFGLSPSLTAKTVQEEDWADAWKEHFHVERFGERIVVRPSWRAYTAREGDVVIDLDPGMAFGTGQHATTRMCLELLEQRVRPGDTVLDVGTGSGILAVAAVKLGAARCVALDIEPRAVQVARENAVRNGVADRVEVLLGSLGEVWPDAYELPRAVDVVVANITAAAVAALAPAIRGALRDGGILIGSGIVGERLDEVVEALSECGFAIVHVQGQGDWRAVLASYAGAG